MTTSLVAPRSMPNTGRRSWTPDRRLWARWLATFIGFPLAGLAARAVVGPIDTVGAAVGGGLAGGAVLGAVQAVGLRRTSADRVSWSLATGVGLAVGLGAGAAAVDFATDTASLVAMGAVTGAAVGVAQAIAMDGGWIRRTSWAAATSALWGLGWLITSQVISDADSQYATFGASGALVVVALGGLLIASDTAR